MLGLLPRSGWALGLLVGVLAAVAAVCAPTACREGVQASGRKGMPPVDWSRARDQMVDGQILSRGVTEPRVLAALRAEPRHEYVPDDVQALAYGDHPLPIGYGQTISQPYIVAVMTAYLAVEPTHRVLEIGTGSGYQAAILDRLAAAVYSMEIVEPLCTRARRDLARLGHGRVQVRCGDGYAGWPEAAPFDRIVITAAPPEIPETLLEQLAPGGRMVVPIGVASQQLVLVLKDADGRVHRRTLEWVRFVPMVHGVP